MTTYRGFDSLSPPTDAAADNDNYTLGTRFKVTTSPIWATHLHFWQPTNNGPSPSIKKGSIFREDSLTTGTNLTGVLDFAVPVTGWNTVELPEPLLLTANIPYKACILYPDGRYAATTQFFNPGNPGDPAIVNGPLTVYTANDSTDGVNGGQGTFNVGSAMAFPAVQFNSANYWSDVTVTDVDPSPPVVDVTLSIADQARANLLVALTLTEPQQMTNVDLMRLLLETPGQTLVTATSASAATHLLRYMMELRTA